MRRLAALQTCLTLGTAFLLAPFQHVHPSETGEAEEHQHSAVIHAHFYAVPAAVNPGSGPQAANSDDDHAAAASLDTFTLVLTAGFSPFLLARALAVVFVSSESVVRVEAVEERVHGPPGIDCSIPRAPPV